MKEEPWFGQNIKEVIKMVKSIFKKEQCIEICPFCLNELKITDTMYKLSMNDKTFEFHVQCPNCKCLGPKAEDYTEALKLWNDRKE